MKRLAHVLLGASLSLVGFCAAAQSINLRGSITAFDGQTISITTRDGRSLAVALPENVNVSITKPLSLSELAPGQTLGVTTIKRASDGATVAIDVRPIPAAARQGLSPYDLQPGSTMTNAVLEGTVQSVGGRELTLNFSTGTVKVLVPDGTPMSRSAAGERSDIRPGESIYLVARTEAGGQLTALRVQVSKDGVHPTQ